MSGMDMMLPLLFIYRGDEIFDVQIGGEPGVVITGCVPLPESLGTFFLLERTPGLSPGGCDLHPSTRNVVLRLNLICSC